jgi:hypothetical protein
MRWKAPVSGWPRTLTFSLRFPSKNSYLKERSEWKLMISSSLYVLIRLADWAWLPCKTSSNSWRSLIKIGSTPRWRVILMCWVLRTLWNWFRLKAEISLSWCSRGKLILTCSNVRTPISTKSLKRLKSKKVITLWLAERSLWSAQRHTVTKLRVCWQTRSSRWSSRTKEV